MGRRREEKTDEPSSASKAGVHTNTSVTPSLLQPTPEREDSDRHALQYFERETHTQITPSLAHAQRI